MAVNGARTGQPLELPALDRSTLAPASPLRDSGASASTIVWPRLVVTLATFTASIHYVWWRVTDGVAAGSWALEAFAYALIALECLQVFSQRPFMYRTRSRSAQVERDLDWYGAAPPRVDVLVPTYGEPWEVLERTLVGAAGQNYGNFKIWVLDDSKREWLKRAALRSNVGYIARDDNRNYKAGNINHALGVLRARVPLDYVALLDADSIARPEFLRRTMALMRDGRVGIVQTPQQFYNPDPFQQVFGVRNWPEEERWWFDMAWPAQDAIDNAQCCGTGCLMRVRALDAIGGFPVASLTEDILCSMSLRRKGWQTVYLREPLVLGLAAESLGAWFSQRARWLYGEIQNQQVLRPRGVLPAIGFWLRVLRFPLRALEKLFWTSAHLIFWYAGYWVVDSSVAEAASHFVPLWLLGAVWIWLSRGSLNPAVAATYATLERSLWLRVPFRAATSRGLRFVVTPKALRREGTVVHVRLLCWHAIPALALAGGVLYNLTCPAAPVYDHEWKWANAIIALCALAQTLVAMVPMVETRQRRSDDRYSTSEEVLLASTRGAQKVRGVNLSVGGVLVEGAAPDTPREVQIHLSSVGWVRGELLRHGIGGSAFRFASPEGRPALIRKLYCTHGYVPLPESWKPESALFAFARWLVRAPPKP